MRRTAIIAALLLTALPASAEARTAPDCNFQDARAYEQFGRIRVFSTEAGLYGCLTDVGRAYRLDTGSIRARSAAARRTVFGVGDWVGFPARSHDGAGRVRALNLRTGATHTARSAGSVTALVVNFDGTLAWIAGTTLRTKPVGAPARALGSERSIDRGFLGLENDQGCAVTWRVAGEQRSSSIHCRRP